MKVVLFDFVNVLYNPKDRVLNSNVVSFLDELRMRSVPLFLFTNVSKESLERYEERLQFSQYFDDLIPSSAYPKSDIRAYDDLEGITGFKYKDMILVDDNPRNIDTAKSLGIGGVLFTNVEDLRKEVDILIG